MRILFCCGAWLLCAVLLSLGLCAQAPAALLVYEPFNYTTGALTSAPNASTVGLSTSTAYSTSQANFTVAAGLSFSNLDVLGNGLNTGASSTYVSAVPFAGLPTVTGTVWNSFLANMTALNATSGNGLAVRLTNNNATSANRYNVYTDIRTIAGGSNVGASYDDSSDQNSTTPTAGSGAVTTGTTYLFLTKIDGVGATNLAAGAGIMTTYVLTASQFDNFIASGRSESFLATPSNVTFTVQDANNLANSATNTFANGNFLNFVAVNATGSIDEVRYGTTLADVTPITAIPEPSTMAYSAIGLGLIALAYRRRQPAA